MELLNSSMRGLLFLTRFLQWASAVIVMGIVSYFLHLYPKGQHTKYWEVIAVLSVAFFLPGLLSPFFPRIGRFAFPIDIIFSYLWLTSFIFAAEDYNRRNCHDNGPPGARCSLKYANEAFIFVAFFMSLMAALLEIYNLWSYQQRRAGPSAGYHSKEARPSGETGTTV
ncbi:hypothetical protein AJ79_08715 [Helicocarpus griseus UAMH5409]|uniref:MARVEL domain-containing protein n=1 Tax=Helicocarpus griseus UAMH5409 TaxID=1447875 RepID=A0A2B7WR00_9EURO|nr:hypothetical protein AJ79_08715 [Helicocarpus griseus UAMH5409]